MLGTFSEAISSEKSLRLYSDASSSISLVYGGAWVDTGSSNVFQPLIVPPNSSAVTLPYMPDQLLLKSGYFSLRSCYFRVFYLNREESTSEYIKMTVEVYVGTRSVVDFYLFRSVSICFKGEGAEVFVPDIHEMFIGVRKNVFVHFSVSGVSGRTYRYSLDSRYCMTFDD